MQGLIYNIIVVNLFITSIISSPIPSHDASPHSEESGRISPLPSTVISPIHEQKKDVTSQNTQPIKSPVPYMHDNNVVSDAVMNQFPRASLRIVGSAADHFRFWKIVHKVALPQVKFLQKILENQLLKFCEGNKMDIPGDCLDFSFNLVTHWHSQYFIRSPNKDVMTIRSQKKFGKGLISDVVEVLNFHKRNLTDLLSIERMHLCDGDDSTSSCNITCPMGNSPYCVVKDVILPNLSTLISKLTIQAKQYYGVHIPQREDGHLSQERLSFFSRYRKYYVMAVLYNTMDQMYETEASLEYLIELSNIQRLSVNYRMRR